MSRLDHPSYMNVRRDDAAVPLPLGQRVGDVPAARHDARQMHTAGGHHLEHDPRFRLKVTVAFGVLCAAVMLLVSCHTEADESWFCAEASCEVTP